MHPSRHDAVPLGKGQRQVVPVPLSRMELPQHRQAPRCAVAGGLCRRPARSEIQCRASAARGILSRVHLRHAQHGCAAAAGASPCVCSARSLLKTENRFAGDNAKGMAYYRDSPDSQPMYMRYTGHGNHFKDKRPNLAKRPGGLWALESAHPGMEHYEAEFIRRYGERAYELVDLAGSGPVNINIFPTLSLLGNQ